MFIIAAIAIFLYRQKDVNPEEEEPIIKDDDGKPITVPFPEEEEFQFLRTFDNLPVNSIFTTNVQDDDTLQDEGDYYTENIDF